MIVVRMIDPLEFHNLLWIINNGPRQKIRSQPLYQKEKQKERLDMYKKYVQVAILADFLLALLLLSNDKDP